MLTGKRSDLKRERIADLNGERDIPAYTTSAGWLGYSDDKMRRLMPRGKSGRF